MSCRGRALLLLFPLLAGCAGSRVYNNDFKHVCLCAVRTARTHGYVIREQEFLDNKGTLVAAISNPDPRGTLIRRNFFQQVGNFFWNAWEHMKFDWGESQGKRARREERITAKVNGRLGPFGWLGVASEGKAKISLVADVVDYGKKDWILKTTNREKTFRERLYADIGDCLAGRQLAAAIPAPALPVAPESPAPVVQPAGEEAAAEPPKEVRAPKPTPKPKAGPAPAPPAAGEEALDERELREMLDRGRQSYEAGNFGEAVLQLEKVLAAWPNNAEALGYLGAALYQAGSLDASIAAYEKYLKLVPGDFRTRDFMEELKKKKQQ